MQELDIPPGAAAHESAAEMIRFWIASGEDHVAVRTGMFAKAQEPGCWGMIAADIVKHAVLGMMADDPSRDERLLLIQIQDAFNERFAHNVKAARKSARRSQ